MRNVGRGKATPFRPCFLRIGICLTVVLASTGPVGALWKILDIQQLVERADAVAIVTVHEIGGEPYGQWALARVDETLKGKLPESIRLPFVYGRFPSGAEDAWMVVSETLEVAFEPDLRYLLVLRTGGTQTPHNLRQALTGYEVVQYYENTIVEIAGVDDLPVRQMRRVIEIIHAPDEAAALELLRPMLTDPDAKVRKDAIRIMANRNLEGAEKVLLGALKDDADAGVREAAARGLGRVGGGPSMSSVLLRAAREDSSSNVRYTAVTAIYQSRATEAAPGLVKLYETAPTDLRNAILTALGILQAPGVTEDFRRFFRQAPETSRKRTILKTMASFDVPGAPELVLKILTGDQPNDVKSAAAWAAAELRQPITLDSVLHLAAQSCTAENVDLIEALIYTIGRLGSPEQRMTVLRSHAACPYKRIRMRVVTELQGLGSAEAIAILLERVDGEPDDEFRERIRRILDYLR